jgi:DNA polymerase-3 subunit gamma/tau
MLKTLEEPPEYLKFVLATTDPQKVPVTVLSRCLQFNLRPMPPDTVLSHLGHVLQAESVPAEQGALRLLARAARGSMRDALSLTDQAIAFGHGELQEASVRQMLGSVDRSHVFELIGALAAADGPRLLTTLDALRLHGFSPVSMLEDMTEVLQRMAVYQTLSRGGTDLSGLERDESDPDVAEIQKLAGLMPMDETQLLYSLCLHGRAELGLAPDEHAALTMVLLRLLAFKNPATAEKKTLNSEPVAPKTAPLSAPMAASAPVSPPVPPPVTAPVPAAAPRVVAVPVRQQSQPAEPPVRFDIEAAARVPARFTDTQEGEVWLSAVQTLQANQSITALVRELALQSQLVSRSPEGHWHLRVERESLNQAATRERLTQALQEAGLATALSVELGPVVDTPARRIAQMAAQQQQHAEAVVMAHPFVQNMMQNFGAKIVPGSLQVCAVSPVNPV